MLGRDPFLHLIHAVRDVAHAVVRAAMTFRQLTILPSDLL